jgi:hypothetical protein
MISKQRANYKERSSIAHCKDCSMFKAPHECTYVKGFIYREGTCEYWQPKNKLPVRKRAA